VFFAGDAAHSLPPYGSRGMNSGIQDADNLAWKLALVLQGHAHHSLLETYHDERYAAARENLAVTEATIRFMVPPSRSRRWARAALLRLAKPIRAVRRHINSGRMAEPYVYTDSPVVDATSGHPLVGHFAPDGWVTEAGRRERIRRLFGAQFVVAYFGTDASAARRFSHEVFTRRSALPTRVVLVLPAGTEIGDLPDQVTVVHDDDPQLRTYYHVARPTWMLIRPDGHIAAAGTDGLHDALLHCTRAAGHQFITEKKEIIDVAS
jgi:3-(3-hydroxy-phenyl)propionate hydroxylase